MTIPERRDQKERGKKRGGRPPAFDVEAYHGRTALERRVSRPKWWRGVVTRCEKRATDYRAMLVIASPMIRSTS